MVALWSGITTFVLVKLLSFIVPLRVSAEDEYEGLDLAVHGERAYDHG